MAVSDLKAKGMRAFVWEFSGKLATHGMSFVISIFLARLLEPSEFGLIAMVMVVVGLAEIFVEMGLGTALIQRRRVMPVHYSSVFIYNMLIGAVLTLLLYVSAPKLADFFNNSDLIALMKTLSFLFLIGAASSVQIVKQRKELNFSLLTRMGLVASIFSGIAGIALAYYGAGVWSLVVQVMLQRTIYGILLWLVGGWRPGLGFSIKALMQLWSFGFRMFIAGFIDTVFYRLDSLIIGKLFTPAVLGYYNRAKSLEQMVITYSSGSLVIVLFPLLSKVQQDMDRYRAIIFKLLGIILFVTLYLLGVLYLVADELVILLFGDQWGQTIVYFKLILLSGFGYPVSSLLVTILSSRGNSKAFLQLEIYKKALFTLNFMIAFTWGVEGYLYGVLIATVIGVYLNIVFISKELLISVRKFTVPIVLQCTLTVAAVFIVWIVNQSSTYGYFPMLLIKAIEYSVLYYLFNKLLRTTSLKYFISEAISLYNSIVKRRVDA